MSFIVLKGNSLDKSYTRSVYYDNFDDNEKVIPGKTKNFVL